MDCDLDDDDVLDCADPVQDIPIQSWIIHPQYTKRKGFADIALLRLTMPAKFSQNNIKPICLPVSETNRKIVPEKFIVTGFGTTETDETSEIMLKAVLPFYQLDKCEDLYKNVRQLPENIICAGGVNRTDSCSGNEQI